MAELPRGKRTINKSKSIQRVNLKELIGRTPTDDEKNRFTLAAIELINDRTLDGKDINGKKFTKYSEKYAEQKGVSRDAVDMFLTGSMLDGINSISSTVNTVTFGIEGGVDALKSDNHNNGVTLPTREFFGITKAEAERIAREIADSKNQESIGFTLADLQEAIKQIGLVQDGNS